MNNLFATLLAIVAAAPFAQATALQDSGLLSKRFASEKVRHGNQAGEVCYDRRDGNLVRIFWKTQESINSPIPPTGLEQYDFLNDAIDLGGFEHGEQILTLTFKPTAINVLDSSSLIIAGQLASGEPVVETWSLVWPATMPAKSIEFGTGISRIPVTLPTVRNKARVYTGAPTEGAFSNVIPLVRSGANSIGALLQREVTREVYYLNPALSSISLLADPAGSVGSTFPAMPSLATNGCEQVKFGAWPAGGYVYEFTEYLAPNYDLAKLGQIATPTFVDTDRDGTIDAVFEYTKSDRMTLGWTDLTAWEKWWL